MNSISLPLDRNCQVIDYHPAGVWALNKATGVLSHPNEPNAKSPCILSSHFDVEEECYHCMDEKGKTHKIYLIHRLDSATSGILLLASNFALSAQLKNAFSKREVEKTYFSIVEYNGKPIRPYWKDFLQKKSIAGKIRVQCGRTGLMALTEVSLERKNYTKYGLLALLKLIPKTGRTHQLRAQCAKRKLPIIGDRTYGNFSLNRKIAKISNCDRLFLHSAKLKIKIGTENHTTPWEVESPLPRTFGKLLS